MDVSKRRHNGNIHKQCSPRQDTTPFGAQPGSTSFAHEINIDTWNIRKRCSPRSDATPCGAQAGYTLYIIQTWIHRKGRKYKRRYN